MILVVVVIMLFGQEKVGTNGENFHAERSMNYLIAYVHGDCTNFMYKLSSLWECSNSIPIILVIAGDL